jgi:hypothetical protein
LRISQRIGPRFFFLWLEVVGLDFAQPQEQKEPKYNTTEQNQHKYNEMFVLLW